MLKLRATKLVLIKKIIARCIGHHQLVLTCRRYPQCSECPSKEYKDPTVFFKTMISPLHV